MMRKKKRQDKIYYKDKHSQNRIIILKKINNEYKKKKIRNNKNIEKIYGVKNKIQQLFCFSNQLIYRNLDAYIFFTGKFLIIAQQYDAVNAVHIDSNLYTDRKNKKNKYKIVIQ